jgi:hypothetical protein
MASQEDRIQLLDDALARSVPGSHKWQRRLSPASSAPLRQSTYWIEIPSPARPEAQRLIVQLRHDGDIQVEYHVANKRGGPFEMVFGLTEGQEGDAIESVAQFVAAVLAERLVLAYAKGFFRGGRRFATPDSLTESERRSFSWITSWLGTFDWPSGCN